MNVRARSLALESFDTFDTADENTEAYIPSLSSGRLVRLYGSAHKSILGIAGFRSQSGYTSIA
jgi:hypothetical protein